MPVCCFLRTREAVHRGAAADAAGVPADDVEPLPHLAREGLVVLRHLDRSGAAGSAGVEEQGADALSGAGGLPFDDGEFDGAATWGVVVERDLRGRAVERTALDAGFPVQLRGGHGRGRRATGRSAGRSGKCRRADHHRGEGRGMMPTARCRCRYVHVLSFPVEGPTPLMRWTSARIRSTTPRSGKARERTGAKWRS